MMRTIVLPAAAWFGVLQAFVPPSAWGSGFATVSRLVAIAISFASLTAMIYHLGTRHQDVVNAKDAVATGIQRIERRLEAFDHLVSMVHEYHQQLEKWKALVERRLRRLEMEAA